MDDPVKAEVRVCAGLADLGRHAATQVARWILEDVRGGGRCTLALAGGSTPRSLYKNLAANFRAKIPWPDVHLFWGDERYVPRTDPRSNYRMVRDALLEHVPVPPENVHAIPTDHAHPEAAAVAYEEALRTQFSEPWPRFDVVLLGVGADGHTASLFPGSPALEERKRWVVPAQAPASADPPQRLTLTFPVLNQAARVCFMVAGKEKAEAVRCALEVPADAARCPAGAVEPARGTLHWWIDREAASLLEPGVGVSE